MKKCIKCFEYKEHFHTPNVCMDCYRERRRLYYRKNKEKDIERNRENRKKRKNDNPEKYKADVKESNKKWRSKNKEYLKRVKKEYYQKNKERDREKRKQSNKNYIENNPKAKFKQYLRTNIFNGIKNYSKNGKTKSCAEYGIDFEAIYNKIGPKPEGNYHLDHIIPMSIFDLDNHEHVRLCNSPENLRWVPGKENLEKYSKICIELILADEKLIHICEVIGLDINKYKKENKND